MKFKYDKITVSGKFGVGKSTLSKHLKDILNWEYINAGAIQRQYDREHHIDENQQGATARPDSHEQEIDKMTKEMLRTKNHIIYEAWLAGFMAQKIPRILKVLIICSNNSIRIDRVVNRENITIDQAKLWISQREKENEKKWNKLYGNYNFWNEKYYDLIIDTYSLGPMQTVGKVLDALGYRGKL